MMETLRIEYHDKRCEGCLELNTDAFLKFTNEQANKVFDLVAKWCSDETIEELKNHFIEAIETYKGITTDKSTFKMYNDIRQRISDNKTIYRSGMFPNGVLATLQQRKSILDQIEEDEKWTKNTETFVKQSKTRLSKCERLLKLLNKHIEKR